MQPLHIVHIRYESAYVRFRLLDCLVLPCQMHLLSLQITEPDLLMKLSALALSYGLPLPDNAQRAPDASPHALKALHVLTRRVLHPWICVMNKPGRRSAPLNCHLQRGEC